MQALLGYLLILVVAVLNLGESMAVKAYAKRYGSGGMLMNAVIALFAALFFLVSDFLKPETRGLYFPAEMLPLALINCCLFAAGFYFAFLAFKIGPYGLTRLIASFSLLFTIFYGIFFLNEKTTALTYIGITMIFAAMVLINYKRPAAKPASGKSVNEASAAEENGVSLKWLIYLLITVFSNGFIGILTRMQQIRFENACSNEFQIISIGGSFILLAVIGVIIDRDKLGAVAKNGLLYGLGAGLCNGAKNFTTLAIYLCLPLSVISPTSTGVGMISAFLVAILFYKEKYTTMQKIGVLLGALAVVLLAL